MYSSEQLESLRYPRAQKSTASSLMSKFLIAVFSIAFLLATLNSVIYSDKGTTDLFLLMNSSDKQRDIRLEGIEIHGKHIQYLQRNAKNPLVFIQIFSRQTSLIDVEYSG